MHPYETTALLSSNDRQQLEVAIVLRFSSSLIILVSSMRRCVMKSTLAYFSLQGLLNSQSILIGK